MTRQEANEIFEKIRNKNNFSQEEIDACLDTQAEKVAQMEKVFDLKEESDYTCLFAVAELMTSEGDIQKVKDNLLEENPFEGKNGNSEIRQPDRNDKLLILTAIENNPLFFSMAWNWIQICKVRIPKPTDIQF